MIQSWKSVAAKAVFLGHSPKGFPADLVRRARRVLTQLNAVTEAAQMRIPPGNRLHALDGDRAGEWSVSVNDQFRITFRWGDDGPEDVWFGDYH